jgi:bifunctional polynucleotide phosphatase/kinase
MDSTLIEPKGKGKFPANRKDWRFLSEFNIEKNLKTLHEEGWKIVIFTNQAGIEKSTNFHRPFACSLTF